MRAGDLRRQVRIEQRDAAQDSFGQRALTWSPIAIVWADIQPIAGREILAAAAVRASVSHLIVIRWRPNITDSMRVVYGTRVYNINAVLDPDSRHKRLQLLCTEGMNDGQ